jgi:hypothetical protein
MAASEDSSKVSVPFFCVRDELVVVDRDLATFYGMRTAALNQQVKRNLIRFPEDFSFILTRDEWRELRIDRGEQAQRGGRGWLPRVFTEQGVGMLGSVLRGRKAVSLSIELIRAFSQRRTEIDSQRLEGRRKATALFDTMIDAVVMKEEERPFTTETAVTYFLQAGDRGPIKIGSTRNLPARLRTLQLMSPIPLRLLGVVPDDIEAECHRALAAWRIHGEWFQPDTAVIDFIRNRCTVKSADLR